MTLTHLPNHGRQFKMQNKINILDKMHLVVIKIGSALLVDQKSGKIRSEWLTSIAEDTGVKTAPEMIRDLVAGQEAVVRTARALFPVVDEANDEPTADLLTQRMQIHEKTAWMLRSLLEE